PENDRSPGRSPASPREPGPTGQRRLGARARWCRTKGFPRIDACSCLTSFLRAVDGTAVSEAQGRGAQLDFEQSGRDEPATQSYEAERSVRGEIAARLPTLGPNAIQIKKTGDWSAC